MEGEEHCPNPVPLTSIGIASVLPKLFVRMKPTQDRRSNLSPTAWVLLGLATAVAVGSIALSSLMLFRRHSRQSQSAKLEQAAHIANVAATVQELAGPWSSKTFIFRRPETKEDISSIVIRLPDNAPDEPKSYWAFSMQTPFGHCQLEYITDLQKVTHDYKFQGKHPMVGDPCSRAVFDPLEMADLPNGDWARGAIVKGYGFRPPLGIEIRIQGDQLVAAKIE